MENDRFRASDRRVVNSSSNRGGVSSSRQFEEAPKQEPRREVVESDVPYSDRTPRRGNKATVPKKRRKQVVLWVLAGILFLASASAAATSVSYSFQFTVNASAGAFVVDFCSNSPLVGTECVAPAGMSAASAAIATAGYTVAATDANTVTVTAGISPSAEVDFVLSGVMNPSTSGLVYARITTYNSPSSASLYESSNLGSGSVDGGTVAFSITDTIGVSGSVMESLTFCVSSAVVGADCSNVQRPVLKLGEQVGDMTALIASAVSEGVLYAQISTNAVGGAVVNLKSDTANCGGLRRVGDGTACDIGPALNQGITAGQALFGVKVASADDTGAAPSGIFRAVTGSLYGASQFAFNYVTGNATGVTSVFGDPFLDTGGAPANNKNVALTFGASVSNDTPAGLYSADVSLIASGKF